MLKNSDLISPYERQLIWVLLQSVMNSHELNVTQKTLIEAKLQEIVNIWNTKEYV